MDELKQYGDLTDKELLEFLNEIQGDDEDIEDARLKSDESIALEEQTSLIELPENAEIEAYYGNDAWRKLKKNVTFLHNDELQRQLNLTATKAIKEKAKRLKEDRIRIQRFAFSQDIIRLGDTVEKESIKKLISLLVKEHTRMISRYEAFINKRLTALLNPLIPKRLRLCKAAYPDSIRASPGFLYRASEEFGGGTFWATPDVPYFFAQNTEQEILKEKKPEFLVSVDKAVVLYNEHKEKRTKKELKYATAIVQKRVGSYFDLLKLNPFWFEALYNDLTKKTVK